MNVKVISGGIAVVAVFAAVIHFARESRESGVPEAATKVAAASPGEETAPREAPRSVVPAGENPDRPTSTDPRLAALLGQPDNPLVEYVAGPDGRVIQEIDNDPASQGYRKPLRDYLYAGDKIAGITTYQYLGTQLQTRRVLVTYKPDGSVDELRETTGYAKP
jgi:hypothetical protein